MYFAESMEARELYLYADNNADVYFRVILPVMKNLYRYVKRGNFDREKAVDAFYPAADFAARKYCRDFGGNFSAVFDVTARFSAACMLFDRYAENIKNGDF